MRDILEGMLAESGTLTTEEILMHIFAALVLGMFIYISYYISHAGTAYSRKFNISLVCLTVLTATVMTVIGNNLSLSLGMVGALSIVRFRTAVKDTRDTIYIFWTIVVGICCGVADYLVACAGSAVIFVILLFLGHVKNENRILLIVKGAGCTRIRSKRRSSIISAARRCSAPRTRRRPQWNIFTSCPGKC